eukprot:GHUV01006110.1.p1 GENE.GHUV01006110.1~~GHUV01006110.1.p1  ORF type:complete len:117 (+),score=22.20 GHUV01006110.1:378-728(+)
MFEAADHARKGDVAYFRGLTAAELTSLIVGRDEDGRTLFHTAAANGHLELLELLAGFGATKVANKQDDEVQQVEYCASVFRYQPQCMHFAAGSTGCLHMAASNCCSSKPRVHAACV